MGPFEAWWWFVILLGSGAVQLYILSQNTYRYWPWSIAGVALALALAHQGLYPPFFERGTGYLTPNRVLGFVFYTNAFCGAVALSAYNHRTASALRHYKEWAELMQKFVWKDGQ